MATWIENEAGDKLLNADHVEAFYLQPSPEGADASVADDAARFCVVAESSEHRTRLLDGLTVAQAVQAVRYLATWLPAQTGRTIRMAELGKNIRRAGLTLVGAEGDHA